MNPKNDIEKMMAEEARLEVESDEEAEERRSIEAEEEVGPEPFGKCCRCEVALSEDAALFCEDCEMDMMCQECAEAHHFRCKDCEDHDG